VSQLFRLNFPYTTVYPALGNLDLLENRERRAMMESGGGVMGSRRTGIVTSGMNKRKMRRRRMKKKKNEQRDHGGKEEGKDKGELIETKGASVGGDYTMFVFNRERRF
jgi:hypothetical protein